MNALTLPSALEAAIRGYGETLLHHMRHQPAPGIFSRKGAYARIMEWTMRDPEFKTQLFRFVDVLPSLGSGAQVVSYLQEYLGEQAGEIHPALGTGLRMASFAPGMSAGLIRAQITDMAKQFVAGTTPADAVKRFRANAKTGIATTIDLLGEAVVSEREADHFLQRNLEILTALEEEVRRNPQPCGSDLGHDGPLPRINLSVKISAFSPVLLPENPIASIEALQKRLFPLLRRAARAGAFINFDMESYHLKEITLELFKSAFAMEEFRNVPAGIVVQAYLRDSEETLQALIEWAKCQQKRIAIRLVKGAYWDYETTLARQRGWPVPVWEQKAESDAHFEKLSVLLLENHQWIQPAFASHNVRSIAHALAQADQLKAPAGAFEFQVLYGMADDLKGALRQAGYRVREYCPVGDLLPGMAYLVRRLLENTSNEGFLRARHSATPNIPKLLANPMTLIQKTPPITTTASFKNAVNTDFTRQENRDRFATALKECEASFGKRWPLVLGGKRVETGRLIPSVNPTNSEQVIGYWTSAGVAEAEVAVTEARRAFGAWASTSVEERAAIVDKIGALIEARRLELNALEVYEAGKPWSEADADISEAVDFCHFYAQEMRGLGQPRVTQAVAGEDDTLIHVPRGVGVVIAPWNFPLAILCGMTVAPLVAGNTVVMKPAEQTSIVASVFMEILEEAGVPAGVVNLLTGSGEEVGPHLVEHPAVDFIVFTGSRDVGLKIWAAAGKTQPGQANLKKVVCEMGGKNALIIDASADLDEAVPAALYSAFGFAGQKCSALSRLIVLEEIYDKFVARLVEAAASFPVGDPARPGIVMGPVIDGEAQEKINAVIERGKCEATLAFQGAVPARGYFVPPTIFVNVSPDSSIAREEIFGPVVAVMKAPDLDAAFSILNATEYALTGGIFSRSPAVLERAKRELRVGNLYLNRAITGAIVERHPFGGYGMSGGGTKAGGKGYLENFLFPRTISENVMRRGFIPEPASEQA